MAGPIIPASFATAQAKAAKALGKQIAAAQDLSEDNFTSSVAQTGFNPAASGRLQRQLNRSKTLVERKKAPEETLKVEEVTPESDEDLAHDFHRRNSELETNLLIYIRRRLNEDSSPEDVIDSVTAIFKDDPTLAHEAMGYLERVTDGPLLETVKQARQIHYEQNEHSIIAGRNVDSVAKYYHKLGLGENPTELRNLYRDITLNPREHNVLFAELSKQYNFDQLEQVVGFLLKGLSYDLKSKGSSIQRPELIRLMTDTRNLQSILWVHIFFKSRMRLIRSLFSKAGVPYPKNITFEHLAKQYISLVDQKYPSVLKLIQQTEQLGFQSDVEKSIILNQFRDATRQLSPRLYQSVKHRQNLRLVIIETLEEVEAEDEEAEEA
ncbi:MAG: hypothetical protein KR126chlam2_00827 [Chlamydiae bacterium]|nr:hypothetical protein [Chlamydiota bacterium]